MKTNTRLATLVAALALVVSTEGSAESFDGSANLVCSTVDVVACTDGLSCIHGHARDFELPDFVFVDFAGKALRAVADSGIKETSPFKSIDRSEHQLVIQGFENHHGWTMAIRRADRQMTLTSTGPDVSFIVFGACTAL